MSGDAIEGFRLKPGDGSKQFSDHLAKLHLTKVVLQSDQANCFCLWAHRSRQIMTAETEVDGS